MGEAFDHDVILALPLETIVTNRGRGAQAFDGLFPSA